MESEPLEDGLSSLPSELEENIEEEEPQSMSNRGFLGRLLRLVSNH
jgi:hypothetical protein